MRTYRPAGFSARQPLSIADPWHEPSGTGFSERARDFGGKWGVRFSRLATIVATAALIFGVVIGLVHH